LLNISTYLASLFFKHDFRQSEPEEAGLHGIKTYTGDRKRKSAMTFPEKHSKESLDKSTNLRQRHTNTDRKSEREGEAAMALTGNSEEEPRDVLHLGARPFNSAPFSPS
jgi:hypothetical protein